MIVGGCQSASNPYFNGPRDNIILARRYQRSASPIAMVTRQARLAEFPNPIDREGGVPFESKRPANHASHFGIEYENVHALTGKLMGTHNDRYGSVWS